MKISIIFQHLIFSCLAISLLGIIFYTNTINDPDEVENKLRTLSRQASSLNLEINQTVLSLQLGGISNYDLISQQTTHLKSIQQSIKNIDNNTSLDSISRFNQQVEQKIQLIESFKSQHALYNNAQLFLLKLLGKTENHPNSNLLLASFIQQSSQIKNIPLLKALTQQAQTAIIYASKSREYATKITTGKTTLVFEQLEREVSQYYSVEHKKLRAIRNILFLVAILSITYIALRKLAKTK